MNLTEWHKAESDDYPILLDKESSYKYVIVRRNVVEKQRGTKAIYEYDEKMIPREEWNLYEDIFAATPYTDTQTAYIDDTEVRFTDVPSGNLTVYVSSSNGEYPNYTVERENDTLTVHFEPLEYVTNVTIAIA